MRDKSTLVLIISDYTNSLYLNKHVQEVIMTSRTMRKMKLLPLACLAMLTSAAQADPMPGQGVIMAAAEIGITPESVVLAGLENQADTMLTRLEDAADLRAALMAKHIESSNVASQVTSLAEQLLSSAEDPVLSAQYAQAVADLEAIQLEITVLHGDLFAVATAGYTIQQKNTLQLVKSNAQYRVPAEFRVLTLTVDEWKSTEKALRAERRALRRGEDLDPVYEALLLDLRTDPAVTSAAQQLTLHLSAVEQVFQDTLMGL